MEATKVIVTQAIIQLQSVEETLAALKQELQRLASTLPEYDTVMSIYGVGEVLGPQLIAEIGDVARFKSKKSLVAFAGIDSPPDQFNRGKLTTVQKPLQNEVLYLREMDRKTEYDIRS